MKLFLLFLQLFWIVDLTAQDSIAIQISPVTAIVKKGELPKFDILVENLSPKSIRTPDEIIISVNNNFVPCSNAIVEIEYLGYEEDIVRVNCCYFGSQKAVAFVDLVPFQSRTYRVEVTCFNFERKGEYRLRFKPKTPDTGMKGQSDWTYFKID
jgi:hypothetical protein